MLEKSDVNITHAIRFFSDHLIEATYLVPTEIGMKKSIMDATSPVRRYLKEKGIHSYDGQHQGPEGKNIVESFFVTECSLIPTHASLYRPKAKGKGGDPRIWISRLSSYAKPNNLLAIVASKNFLYIINFSDKDIVFSINTPNSPLNNLREEISSDSSASATELLEKLREISARGWIETVRPGDTGVGATLEHCLGISINSSKTPDFKGIELKAKRKYVSKQATRSTLFAQVPNWEISELKSSAAILDEYGYYRDGLQRLNCTVSSPSPNSQGLVLIVDYQQDILKEMYLSDCVLKDVVAWKFDALRKRLLTKHNETFWVEARASEISGIEHFHYTKVLYTKAPYAFNFDTLCQQGVITVDHLIKRDQRGRVSERGPLFKISPSNIGLLFPPPVELDLATYF